MEPEVEWMEVYSATFDASLNSWFLRLDILGDEKL